MQIVAGILIVIGLLAFTGGTVGILRMPDFYCRLHPAGKLDSLGLLCCLLGLALYNISDFSWGSLLLSLKLLLVVVFIYQTSPTATHALADCALRAGLKYWRKGKMDKS